MDKNKKFEHDLLKNFSSLLKDSYIQRSPIGIIETISVQTQNRMAEKFHLEIMYKKSADRNGIPPIMSARFITPYNMQEISNKTAAELIRMCYALEVVQQELIKQNTK